MPVVESVIEAAETTEEAAEPAPETEDGCHHRRCVWCGLRNPAGIWNDVSEYAGLCLFSFPGKSKMDCHPLRGTRTLLGILQQPE